jgi:hypothetical protein
MGSHQRRRLWHAALDRPRESLGPVALDTQDARGHVVSERGIPSMATNCAAEQEPALLYRQRSSASRRSRRARTVERSRGW